MSDTSTRSGMLWEVERILTECEEKPQVLLMENVPQVHGEGAIEDFEKIRKNQSDASLYHLAGDSIVVNVLMAIFGEMINENIK